MVGLIGAGNAQAAATIDYDYAGGTITIIGTPNDDVVQLEHDWASPAGASVVMISNESEGSTLTPTAIAAGCIASASYQEWQCPRPALIVVHLGAAHDVANSLRVGEYLLPFTVPLEVHGGPNVDFVDGGSGDDLIYGGDGNDELNGRAGNDRIFGEGDRDVLNGGPGDDHLDGGTGDDEFESPGSLQASLDGNDTYVGGPGSDRFSYFNRPDPVTITLDGIANDGMAGEADNIHPDIETVGGSAGNDVITGSPGPDRLWGSAGDDVIRGLGGDDHLSGDGGNDILDGGPGNDELVGGCMTDTLIGGPGADTFNSDSSTCSPQQRSTFDRIEAADGERDALIFCQQSGDPAGDTAIVDAIDPVTNAGPGACATISVVTAQPGPNPPGGGSGGSGGSGGGSGATTPLKGKARARLGKTLTLLTGTGRKGQAAKMGIDLKRKRLTLGTLRATKKTKVATTATIRRSGRTVTLGRLTVTVKAGTTRTLQIRLSKNALRALKRLKKTKVTTTFKVGKQRYRKAFTVRVARR